MSLSNHAETAVLNAFRGTPFSISTLWVKLHIGDPGEDGLTNPALNSNRRQVTFGSPSGSSMSNSGVVTWTNVGAAETYTHISIWDAATGGNCWSHSNLQASKPVSIGDNVSFDTFSLTWTMN